MKRLDQDRSLMERYEATLASRKQRQMLRSLATLEQQQSKELIDFSSNDYLALADSETLHQKFITQPGPLFGPSSSRLLAGNTSTHLLLESQLASFFGYNPDEVLLFNSGFSANSSLWSTLPAKQDFVVYDSLIHASVHDGLKASRLSKNGKVAFEHNNLNDLDVILRRIIEDSKVQNGQASVWVIVEGLYSMDGDCGDLKGVSRVIEDVFGARSNCHLVVDEAHSTGVYGRDGRGLVDQLGLESKVSIRLHTFGKALSCTGAVALINSTLRNYLINYGRPLIYSTAMPYMNVRAISCSISMLEEGLTTKAREHLHALSDYTRDILKVARDSTIPSSPILPLITPNPRALCAFLLTQGFVTRPVTYPTVPRGLERVRICLNSGHTFDQVQRLAKCVDQWQSQQSKL